MNKSDIVRTIVVTTSLVLLYQDVVSGASRYLFNSLGLISLQYLPSLAVIIVALLYSLGQAFVYRRPKYFLFLLIIQTLFIYSIIMGRLFPTVYFALYTWGAFFIGFIAMERGCFKDIAKHLPIIWGIAVVGVLLNANVTFPWFGETYEVLGVQVEVARAWSTFGVERLSGFAKSSSVAANQIAIAFVVIASLNFSRVIKIFAFVISMFAISLTTSKTPLILLVIAPALIYLFGKFQSSDALKGIALLPFIFITLGLLEAAVILPPFEMSAGELSNTAFEPPKELPFLKLDSLVDRARDMWPGAFDLMHADGADGIMQLFGRGLGGIGAAQALQEEYSANSADNLFVFLWVTFGAVGAVVFFGSIMIGCIKSINSAPEDARIYYALSIAILVLGTLTNVIESILPGMALGVITAKAFFQSPRQNFSRSWTNKAHSYSG